VKLIEVIIESLLISGAVFFISYFYLGYRFERILRKIAMAGALSPETAVKPEDAGITSDWDKTALRGLVRKGKLAVTEDGRYYVIKK
jgi:hypothetical protein